MAGQTKLWARTDPKLGSPVSVHQLLSCFTARYCFLRIVLSLRGEKITNARGPLLVILLDPVKGHHALLLDVQRLDPWCCFPLRISRQESALWYISSSHTYNVAEDHICCHVAWNSSGSQGFGVSAPEVLYLRFKRVNVKTSRVVRCAYWRRGTYTSE